MINLSDLIEECKNQICHKANMAGIRFLEEDLISVREQDTTVVFLKRQLLGYKQDENDNYILDENGNKITPNELVDILCEIVAQTPKNKHKNNFR